MDEKITKARENSFYITLIYVGLGTSLFFIQTGPNNDLVIIVYSILVILTVPVTFIGWAFFYSGGYKVIFLVLGIQIVVFFVFWFIIYRYLLKKYKRQK
jgi:hypothetical protein